MSGFSMNDNVSGSTNNVKPFDKNFAATLHSVNEIYAVEGDDVFHAIPIIVHRLAS